MAAAAARRVAMVSEHASPLAALGSVDAGGQNVYVASLARELARRGHEVTVYTRRDDPMLPDRVPLDEGVVVEHVPAGPTVPVDKDDLWPHMPVFAARLRERLLADVHDVLHTHFWMSGYAGDVVARDLDLPWVHTFHALGVVKRRHQGDADRSPAGRHDVERCIAQRADRVVATCRDEVAELQAFAGPLANLAVVPCGVDTEVFRPHGPACDRSARTARLVSVSRLVPRKGIADVVRALRDLPQAELVVAGGPPAAALRDDPEHRRLRDVAAEVGVAGRVRFVGALSQHDVAALLRSADLAVCVPAYEPFGIAPIEAMACGTPVVGSAVGGLLDTVVDGETGRLVPPGRPDLVAAAAAELLADPVRRMRMGRRAAARSSALYGWPRVAARVEAVYEDVLRCHTGSDVAAAWSAGWVAS